MAVAIAETAMAVIVVRAAVQNRLVQVIQMVRVPVLALGIIVMQAATVGVMLETSVVLILVMEPMVRQTRTEIVPQQRRVRRLATDLRNSVTAAAVTNGLGLMVLAALRLVDLVLVVRVVANLQASDYKSVI